MKNFYVVSNLVGDQRYYICTSLKAARKCKAEMRKKQGLAPYEVFIDKAKEYK